MSEKYTDLSLDLETLGNGPNSVILSIGAVMFDKLGVDTGPGVEVHVDIDSQLKERVINGSTVMWWFDQAPVARQTIIDGQDSSMSLCDGLLHLSRFIDEYAADPAELKVWGNGATFDNVILGSAYKDYDLPTPWEYWNDSCLRTLRDLYEFLTNRVLKDDLVFTGVPHSAIDDAEHQAKLVQQAYSVLSHFAAGETAC